MLHERKRAFKNRLKVANKELIANTLERCIGDNLTPAEAHRLLNLPLPTICEWMSSYWFYKKPNDPVIIMLESNV
jgi:hypothetical protein